MKSRFPSFLLGVTVLSLAFAGCGGDSAQLRELRSYIQRVKPIALSLTKEGDAFNDAMLNDGAPDQAAIGSIRGSLQTSIDTLQAIPVTDAKIKAAHNHLILGVQAFRDAIDRLLTALKNPTLVPANFEEQEQAMVTAANEELGQWQQGIAEILPKDERAEFMSDGEDSSAPGAEVPKAN